jgi:plastocyanin
MIRRAHRSEQSAERRSTDVRTRTRTRTTATLTALALLPAAAVACSGSGTATTGVTAPATSLAAPATGASAASGATVTAKLFAFTPTTLTVRGGSAVTFSNEDQSPHQPTSGAPGEPTATFDVTIGPGESGSTGALPAGTYPYFCQLHTSMLGEIVVQ